ncbi:MAG: FG-GAP repeat domain-containing protein [Acidimicrobiia bacterium]
MAEDFNGDGFDDVIAFYDYGSSQTKVWFFRGNANGIGRPVAVWDSGVGDWDWRRTWSVAGDFDGDGFADVTAFYDYGSGVTKAWLFRGNANGVAPPVITWDSGINNWHWSRANPVAANFNGDAYADVIAFYDEGPIRDLGLAVTAAWLFQGGINGVANGSHGWQSFWWDWSRTTLVAGDFNGDGGDVIAFYDYGSSQTKAWFFRGRTDGIDGPVEIWNSGVGNWDSAGSRSVAGDFNGDGFADVISFYDYGSSQTKAWFFRGRADGIGSPVDIWNSGVGNWDSTRTKSVAGDFNGDGFADVIAFYDYGSSQTKAWLFRGTSNGVGPPLAVWDSGVNNWDAARM